MGHLSAFPYLPKVQRAPSKREMEDGKSQWTQVAVVKDCLMFDRDNRAGAYVNSLLWDSMLAILGIH